jgi:hypothetical protein
LAIPASLQASLLARLDRLAPAREVAQIGAALGRQFSHELLSAVAPMPPAQLDEALGQLVASELVYRRGTPPDAEYTFKHALVQDAAYSTLLRGRRQHLHTRIAVALEERFPGTVESQPELLAHHCTEAGLSARAVRYWQQAGERATQRSANVEAIAHLTKGLETLKTLPETPEHTQQALTLYTALGTALVMSKGLGAPRYTPDQHRAPAFRMGQNPGVGCRIHAALLLWLLGIRSEPWPDSTRPWRWRTSCRFHIVWRMRGVGRPTSISFSGTCQRCTSRQRPPSRSRSSRAFHSKRSK